MDAETASLLDTIRIPVDYWFRGKLGGLSEQEFAAAFLIAAAKEMRSIGPIPWEPLITNSVRNGIAPGSLKTGMVGLIRRGLVRSAEGIKGPYTINPELLQILAK